MYRYFRDCGLGGEIREGLILQFCDVHSFVMFAVLWCHYYKWPYIETEIFAMADSRNSRK